MLRAIPVRSLLVVFFAALILRLFFLPFSLINPKPLVVAPIAFDGYYQIATSLMEGHGFSRPVTPPLPDSVRTPLYPLFLVAIVSVFGSYKAVILIQVLLGAFTAVFAWLIAREFLKDDRLAFIVGLLCALEPLTAYLTGTILTETLFDFLFLLSLLVFMDYLRTSKLIMLVLASLLFGIGTLVKPTVEYAPILLVGIIWYQGGFKFTKNFFLHSVVLLLIFIATLSPWLYRNYVVFDNPGLAVQPVSNLFAYLVPSTIALEENISYQNAANQFLAQEHVNSIEDVNLGNEAYYKKLALAELEKHPKGLVMSIGITMYAFFLNDNYATVLQRFFSAQIPERPPFSELLHPSQAFTFFIELIESPAIVVVIGRIFWLFVTLLVLWGAWRYARERTLTPLFILFILFIAYFASTTIVIGLAVNGRFRVPVDPFLFMFAVYGAASLLRTMKRNDSSVASRLP